MTHPTRRSTGLILALFVVSAVVVTTRALARGGERDSVAAVRSVLDRQVADWNKHDLDGFLEGYWNSPKLSFQSGGNRVQGWQTIRDRYRSRYQAAGRSMGTLQFMDLEIEPLAPDVAFAKGAWRVVMPDGSQPHGLFTLILKRFPEGWKIVHDHTSAAEPAASVATSAEKATDPATAAGPSSKKIDALLRDELTRLWYPRAVDRVRGGFHQSFARDWSPQPDDSTFVVYQARMTWTAAAFAAYAPEHRKEFTEYARHGIEFLDTVLRDKEKGGFYWMLDPAGKVDPKRGTDKHAYGISFVIHAAATVRAVTGDDRALLVARDAFDWLDLHGHDAEHLGYFESFRCDGTPITDWERNAGTSQRADQIGIYYGFKTMNVHIHLLEALTALVKVDSRPVIKERLAELHKIVRDKIAVEPGALNLYLTRDWRAIPAHDSFGHDLETAYLLIEAAEALGIPDDPRTQRMARLLVDHALDWGWDEKDGGFHDKGESFGGPALDRTKVWWTQAEGLNALHLMERRHGSETDRYGKAFIKQWQFIEKHLIDPTHGGWFGETTADGQLLGDGAKATPWKANYHTSRAMMNVASELRSRDRDRK